MDGMPLDPATIARILDRQGMPPTADNMNRIMQAAASDPTILERYSMGTARPQAQGGRDIRGGGGPDDNAALLQLNKNIDQSIAKTDLVPQAPAVPPPPAPAPAPRAAAPTARRGVAPNTEPPPGSYQPLPPVNPIDIEPKRGFDISDLLVPILGPLASVLVRRAQENVARGAQGDLTSKLQDAAASDPRSATYQANKQLPQPAAQPALSPPPPRAPAPYGTDIERTAPKPNTASPAVPMSDPMLSNRGGNPTGQTVQDIQRMQQEVNAENDAARLQQQIKESARRPTRGQLDAQETVRRAKGATGRKP